VRRDVDALRLPKREGDMSRLLLVFPSDESCFCAFEAPDAEDVRLVNELAEVPFARITGAYEIGATPSDHNHEGGSA
jgi:hypothetical protein